MKTKFPETSFEKETEKRKNSFEKDLKERNVFKKQETSTRFKPLLVSRTRLGKALIEDPTVSEPREYLKDPLKEAVIADILFPNLESKILVVDRVCHTLEAGKIYRYRVTAAVGDRRGVIGLGVGKHKFKDKAIIKAIDQAKKNMFYLESTEKDLEFSDQKKVETETETEKNIYHGPDRVTESKLSGTVLEVSPLLSDSVTASKWGQEYCKIGGITRIKICLKRKSSVASKMNYYKALHEALKKQTR